jgi:alkylation response protein AidB-like acyl-CoA dehydrogenase
MDLHFDEDQLAFRQTLTRYLKERYPAENFIRESAAMGFIGAAVGEDAGGVGLSTVESLSVHELCAEALVAEPFLGMDAAAQLIERQATPDQAAALLPGLLSGAVPMVLAHQERGTAASELDLVTTEARPDACEYALFGHKAVVVGGPEAARLLVSAALADGTVGVFVVDRSAAGVTTTEYRLVDGRRVADIQLAGVRVAPGDQLGRGDATAALRYVVDYLVLGLCAELVGVVAGSIAKTTEYVKIRQQFGQPIGRFQAVQHRLADMLVEYEQCRSILYYAMAALDSEPVVRRAAIHLAKGKAGAAGRAITGSAVQLHGGIGVTEEYIVGRYLKRAVANDLLLGSSSAHFRQRSLGYARQAS